MTNQTKKVLVLGALFILPLLLYIFLSSGINNFGKLPVLTENVIDVVEIDSTKRTTFKRKISIVLFLGNNIEQEKSSFFNLNQKIYKQFYGFKDFQVVAIYPKGKTADVEKLQKEMSKYAAINKWNFIPASAPEIEALFDSFNTGEKLQNLHSNKAYLVDKESTLRGRVDDKRAANGKLYGYNMRSVGELNDKMKDDVKVLLAEYRLALKKNKADRQI